MGRRHPGDKEKPVVGRGGKQHPKQRKLQTLRPQMGTDLECKIAKVEEVKEVWGRSHGERQDRRAGRGGGRTAGQPSPLPV